jgi:hypothetical protein
MCLDDGVGIVSVPNYACFDNRLLTFTGWSIERPSPVDLAKAGFYNKPFTIISNSDYL